MDEICNGTLSWVPMATMQIIEKNWLIEFELEAYRPIYFTSFTSQLEITK